MLQAIRDDYLHWQCLVFNRYGDLVSCGEHKTAHIDEVIYREAPQADKPGSGAMIDLPRCACGAQISLKADYTLKELWHETVIFTNEQGEPQVYALPLQHVRNLRLHHILYEQGRAEHAPVLPMPAQEVLSHPQFAQIEDPDGICALWFGFAVARQYVPTISGIKEHMLALAERTTGAE